MIMLPTCIYPLGSSLCYSVHIYGAANFPFITPFTDQNYLHGTKTNLFRPIVNYVRYSSTQLHCNHNYIEQ